MTERHRIKLDPSKGFRVHQLGRNSYSTCNECGKELVPGDTAYGDPNMTAPQGNLLVSDLYVRCEACHTKHVTKVTRVCSNCELDISGDGDLYVHLELRESRGDMEEGFGPFQDHGASMDLCLVCFDDDWRLEDPTDINFYTTKHGGNMFQFQLERRLEFDAGS